MLLDKVWPLAEQFVTAPYLISSHTTPYIRHNLLYRNVQRTDM